MNESTNRIDKHSVRLTERSPIDYEAEQSNHGQPSHGPTCSVDRQDKSRMGRAWKPMVCRRDSNHQSAEDKEELDHGVEFLGFFR